MSYDGSNPFGEGFLNLEQSGEDTLIKFDKDGNEGSESEGITIAILKNVQASSLVADNFNPNFPPDGSPPSPVEIQGTLRSR